MSDQHILDMKQLNSYLIQPEIYRKSIKPYRQGVFWGDALIINLIIDTVKKILIDSEQEKPMT